MLASDPCAISILPTHPERVAYVLPALAALSEAAFLHNFSLTEPSTLGGQLCLPRGDALCTPLRCRQSGRVAKERAQLARGGIGGSGCSGGCGSGCGSCATNGPS